MLPMMTSRIRILKEAALSPHGLHLMIGGGTHAGSLQSLWGIRWNGFCQLSWTNAYNVPRIVEMTTRWAGRMWLWRALEVKNFEPLGFFASLAPTQKMLRNDHWILQSVYLQEGCGFPIHRLDFVGLLMSDKWQVNLQVRAMLHGFGLSLESAKNLADEYFPRKGWASDNQKKHSNIHGEGEGHLFRTFYSQKDCNDETSVDFLWESIRIWFWHRRSEDILF